jgi:hypothetical protein
MLMHPEFPTLDSVLSLHRYSSDTICRTAAVISHGTHSFCLALRQPTFLHGLAERLETSLGSGWIIGRPAGVTVSRVEEGCCRSLAAKLLRLKDD